MIAVGIPYNMGCRIFLDLLLSRRELRACFGDFKFIIGRYRRRGRHLGRPEEEQ
jgi:hypothetical protein